MYCQRCGTNIPNEASFCSSCGLDVTSVGGAPPPIAEAQPADELALVQEALKDEYDVIKELGRGGMAIVFQARDRELDREVAIKVLPASMGFDAEFVERFQREAKTAAKLEHPSIIPIYRVGKKERTIFFVMKFLRGRSLADLVDDHGKLDPAELRRLLSETASALGYAHKHEIVHRDIKPDNILLDDTGRAIVTDFGIAKAATGAKLTGTGMAIGTPHYMSPEQARATPLDGRSDIYSLGVCAYQCLTGHVPFDGTDAFSIGYKHITEPVPEPPSLDEGQRALYDIVRKMMAKDPNDRYQTADELCRVLDAKDSGTTAPAMSMAPTTPIRASAAKKLVDAAEAHAASITPTTPIAGADVLAASTTPTTPMPRTDFAPAEEEPTRKKSRGGMLVAAALLVIVGGGGGGYVYYTNFFDNGTGTVVANDPVSTDPATGARPAPPQDPMTAVADSGADATTDSTTTPDSTEIATPPPPAAPTTGHLRLVSLPARGQVTVDGRSMRGRIYELDPGRHRLSVTAPGREDFSWTGEINAGDTTSVRVRMAEVAPPPADEPPPAQADACTNPGPTYNAGNVCHDTDPTALDPPLVTLNDDVQGNPAPLIVWVKVSPEGRAVAVQPTGAPENPAFYALAVAYAQQMRYNPAQKSGQPVEGWFQLQLIPTR